MLDSGTYREGPFVKFGENQWEVYYLEQHIGGWRELKDTLDLSGRSEVIVYNPLDSFIVPLPVGPVPAREPAQEYALPEKFLAMSDIEGNFYALRSMLLAQGVMNANYEWTFGEGHLVMDGDLVDRGSEVTACLWLIYKLEKDAEAAGGRVHTLLGNHEIMVFSGDYRYTDSRYLNIATSLGCDYSTLLGPQFLMGQWLRSRSAIVKLGDILVSHAGIGPSIADLGLTVSQINSVFHRSLNRDVLDLGNQEFMTLAGPDGVLWYRGWIEAPPKERMLNRILEQYGVNKMIVGHTPVNDIKVLYSGKMIAIDIVQPTYTDRGVVKALLYRDGHYYQVTDQGDEDLIL